MMEHYVTLLDSLFLPQGVTLHGSMERYAGEYTLWILCVDEQAYRLLTKLDLPNVRLLPLAALETPELVAVKEQRSRGEYCWTLTPFAPRFVFEADFTVQRVTYLDADIWFRKKPDPIFAELENSGKHVLITEHAYSPQYDLSESHGIYCVQFMTFTRDGSEAVRSWWEKRCIEWCYARIENGKFGDQKYLDVWPLVFGNLVHVLRDRGLALAPWNATRFPYSEGVFYHFHQLRILSNDRVSVGQYALPKPLVRYVYSPYLCELKNSMNLIVEAGGVVGQQTGEMGIIARCIFRLSHIYSFLLPMLSPGILKI